MKGMTSYLFNGQWTTDKDERKYGHMSTIPFPVCAYAAIYYEGRRLSARKSVWTDPKYKTHNNGTGPTYKTHNIGTELSYATLSTTIKLNSIQFN